MSKDGQIGCGEATGVGGQHGGLSLGASIMGSNKPSDLDFTHARLLRYLNPGQTFHFPWGDVGYPNPVNFPEFKPIIYRPEIYEVPSRRQEDTQVYTDDEIALMDDRGYAKSTKEGGVWDVGDPDRFETGEDVLELDPEMIPAESFGPELVARLRKLADSLPPKDTPMARQYATLLVRALLEFGWEPLLEAAAMDEKKFGRILDRFGEASLAIFRGWAEIDRVPMVYLHDDIAMTSGMIFRPDWYRKYIFPWYKRFVDVFHASGKKVLYVSDGNYLPVMDDILDIGMDGLAIETSSMDPAEVMAMAGRDRFYVLSADHRVMDFGTPEEVHAQVEKLYNLHHDFPAMWVFRGGTLDNCHPNAVAYAQSCKAIFGNEQEAR